MSCVRATTGRDGTSQRQRFVFDLNPANLKIEDLDIDQFLVFLSRFSELINYYNLNNQKDQDWKPFFTDEQLSSAGAFFVKKFQNNQTDDTGQSPLAPHLSLLLVFFKLYQYLQHDINHITRRHLDYYYKEFLRFKPRAGSPSFAFLLFELTKTATPVLLEAETRLRAGKDLTGADQFYALVKDVLINKATLAAVKSIYVQKAIIHPGTTREPYRIFVSHAADSADGKGTPLEKPENGWKPFGENQDDPTLLGPTMQPTEIGLAISSPIFLLKEGIREILIELHCSAEQVITLKAEDLVNTVRTFFSSKKGWIEASVTISVNTTNKECTITLKNLITADKPAIEVFSDTVGNVAFNWPAVKIVFAVSSANSPYPKLHSLKVSRALVLTRVISFKGLSLYNEQGAADTSKPFLPFGSAPKVGSKLFIGSPEIFSKKLTNLSISITWMGLPEGGLGKYYKSYFKETANNSPPWLETSDDDPFTNTDYKADLELLQAGVKLPLKMDVPVFNLPPDEKEPVLIESLNPSTLQSTRANPQLVELPPVTRALAGGYMLLTFRGLTYSPSYKGIDAFGHAEFPSTFSDIAIGKATPGSTLYANIAIPNPPYTPLIESMEVNYEAIADLRFNETTEHEKFFHVEPFGFNRPEPSGNAVALLPQFKDEGSLYIGLKDLAPSQFISMLFRCIEGSGNPETPLVSKDIKWAYLAGNNWVDLSTVEVVSENTSGFQKTGIVELSLGRDVSRDHTLLTPGLSWIRASVDAKADGACRIQSIHTQAALATYAVRTGAENDPLQDFPIAADTITKLEISNTSIKRITQLLPSFSGGVSELSNEFYSRVSERLRHRRRAINLWDYEHLVLQDFPEIYKVKCIPHWKGTTSNFPGWVTVVLVPYPYNKHGEIRLEPKNSLITLRAVEEYLQELSPSPIEVVTVNPAYERIFLDFKVSFFPGLDGGYFGQLLNEELKQLLSPWAYDQQQDIIFGGSVFRSDIINFIENREYVDYVTDFNMYSSVEVPDGCPGLEEMRIIDFAGAPERIDDFTVRDIPTPGLEEMVLEESFVVGEPLTLAMASTPLSVLVSAANHRIRVLRPLEYTCSGIDRFGLGNMILEIDFEIANT